MSFTNNASNLTGKSTTNTFNVIADSLTVNKNTLCKGDLTVLGTTNIGNVSLENGFVNNLTVNNFTATNPVPIASGGTGLATLGAPNQVLTVNNAGTALVYQAQGLINPATITGTGFTGNPTLSLGLEADTGSLGRGFIRSGVAAVNGLFLGTSSATVLRLWSNFATDSNAEIINTNANFTYNSTGSSGVFQVLSGGGGISFTNSGIGTISMATSAGNVSLAAGAGTISLTTGLGSTSITTGGGPISLTTGAGNISLTTAAAGIISITTATAGAINIGANVGLVNLYGSGITLGAPAIYIGGGNSVVPILSAVVFACGDVTGVTGFWNITTLAFQLNAVSISLNSSLTIALNNNTTVSGSSSSLTSPVFTVTNSQAVPLFTVAALAPNLSVGNTIFSGIGSSLSAGNSGFISFTNDTISYTSWSTYSSTTSIKQEFNGKIILTAPTTDVNGILNVINGNIFTNQNIIGGITIINNGNVALSASSPGYILIRGGSGSIITLPDATTLIVGYTYTINNNTNNATTVNRHVSGLVGSVPALSAATVICIGTSSANGQWDIHITGPSTGTDWATPGQIGSAVPNTGVFTTLSATGQIFGNLNNLLSTTVVNPGITIWNDNPGNKYGMDLGYNATSTRFRTRIFAATFGDISLATGTGANQSDFTDRLIVRGDTGNVQIICPDMSISGISTNILGALNVTGTSTSLGDAGCLKVNNSSTAVATTLASFLQPTLGTIGVALESVNLTFGKSHTTNNSAQLQFGYQLSSPAFNNPITVWGFYNLTGTNIKLQENPPINQSQVTVTGNTQIVGDLSLTGTVTIKNSSALYVQTTNFLLSPNVWSDVQAIAFSRGSGATQLTPTFFAGIFTGFVNNTSLTLQTSISFSCRRSDTNSGGENSLRISYGTVNDYIAEQYFEGLQAGTVSANFNLLPSERLRCLIFPVAIISVEYGSVRITINTTPIV